MPTAQHELAAREIVAAEEQEIFGTNRLLRLESLDIARGVLDGHDSRVLGERRYRLGLDVALRAPGHVVEHHGPGDRIGNGREVRDEAALRRLVVVRRHEQETVDALDIRGA